MCYIIKNPQAVSFDISIKSDLKNTKQNKRYVLLVKILYILKQWGRQLYANFFVTTRTFYNKKYITIILNIERYSW